MSDDLILFHIEGPDGDETARELFDLLRAEFGVRPERMDRETRRRADPGRPDPIPVTALIIAVPGEVLAAFDPTAGARALESLGRVVAWAVEKEKTAPDERIAVQPPEGKIYPLKDLDAETLIQATARPAAAGPD